MGRAAPADLQAWAGQELWAPCFQVQVAGTTGAGDATLAGFLSALLRDLPPRQAVIAAVAVGACNVEAVDTISGIRPWEETLGPRRRRLGAAPAGLRRPRLAARRDVRGLGEEFMIDVFRL